MSKNPPAFPNLAPDSCGPHIEKRDGMTLVDWFASQALIGLLANPVRDTAENWSWQTGTLTGDAYMFGEAMLDERKHQAPDPALVELIAELRLWRSLVNEGGVPRYTVTPGAALNTIVTSTDALLRKHREM